MRILSRVRLARLWSKIFLSIGFVTTVAQQQSHDGIPIDISSMTLSQAGFDFASVIKNLSLYQFGIRSWLAMMSQLSSN